MFGKPTITYSKLRFEMTTSQLVSYAQSIGIQLNTTEGKNKKKIANQIWKELEKRGFVSERTRKSI